MVTSIEQMEAMAMGRAERIECWQAKKIHESLRPTLKYLAALTRRLDAVAYDPTSALYREANKARDALQNLLVELHYLSIPSGVCRESHQDTTEPPHGG